MSAPKVAVAFRPRAEPLAPVAAAARGPVARALIGRLLASDDATLAKLRGAAADGIVIVIGDAGALPWVDGIVYLGNDPEAPSLLLPTTLAVDVPAALFERAVMAHRKLAAPVAVLVDPHALVSVAGARPIDRARLAALGEGAP